MSCDIYIALHGQLPEQIDVFAGSDNKGLPTADELIPKLESEILGAHHQSGIGGHSLKHPEQ